MAGVVTKVKFVQDGEEAECLRCGDWNVEWEECAACFGEGSTDLYELNPIEYEPGEVLECDQCYGKGGWWICYTCGTTSSPH